jgi:hypothetical protein
VPATFVHQTLTNIEEVDGVLRRHFTVDQFSSDNSMAMVAVISAEGRHPRRAIRLL